MKFSQIELEKLATLLIEDTVLVDHKQKFANHLNVADAKFKIWKGLHAMGQMPSDELFYNILKDWDARLLFTMTKQEALKELEIILRKTGFIYCAGNLANFSKTLSSGDRKSPPKPAHDLDSNNDAASGGVDCPDSDDCCCTSSGQPVSFKGATEPLIVQVVPRTLPLPLKDVYPTPPNEVGMLLMINIIEFVNLPPEKKRVGAKQDEVYLESLFKKMNYKVYRPSFDIETKEDLADCIKDFKRYMQKFKVHSCIVFVGSHGSHGKVHLGNDIVDIWDDIVHKFSNKATDGCPQLVGKPKIFLIQACQGRKQYLQDDDDNHEMCDAIVCFATMPGFVSKRHITCGSLFIYTFTKTLMENAHNQHFMEMIETVNRSMEYTTGGKPEKQIGVYSSVLLDPKKAIYFNPA